MRFILPILFFLACANILFGQVIVDSSVVKDVIITNVQVINTGDHEGSPMLVHDQLMYVKFIQKSKKERPKKGEFVFDLYASTIVNDAYTKPEKLGESLNSEFVEGPGSFYKKDNTIYFTRSNIEKSKKNKKIKKLRVYQSQWDGTDWKAAELVPFLLGDFNFCHPAVDDNSQLMILASDMPGGFGGMDLYYCVREDSTWSKPVNMGPNVNSEKHEIFPTLDNEELFFSVQNDSTGLDIYHINFYDRLSEFPVALTAPINSDFDDFGLVLNQNKREGYFTSSRPGGKGKDDIYRLRFPNEIFKRKTDSLWVNITVIDKLKLEGVVDAELKLTKLDLLKSYMADGVNIDFTEEDVVFKLKTDSIESKPVALSGEGSAFIPLENDEQYLVSVSAKGYETAKMIFIVGKLQSDWTILLNPIEEEVPVVVEEPVEVVKEETFVIPTKKGESVVFENIYYRTNSAIIEQGAAAELDQLVEAMKTNPKMRVQLSAHTDAIGNEIYNQILSDQRAESAKRYLTKRGIRSSRIVALGFGESRIRNHCKEGVKCSKEEHRFNRRTDVKILEN